MQWYSMPSGPAREAAKQAAEPQAPIWQYVRGPSWIKNGPNWISSDFQKCYFTDEATKLWAFAQCQSKQRAPRGVTATLEDGTLILTYRNRRYVLPVVSPSDVSLLIRRMRFQEDQL